MLEINSLYKKFNLEDFIYNGKYFEKYECDLPQVKEVDETFKERIAEYIVESWLETQK